MLIMIFSIKNGLPGLGIYKKKIYLLLIKNITCQKININRGGKGGGFYSLYSLLFKIIFPKDGGNSIFNSNGINGINGILFITFNSIFFINNILIILYDSDLLLRSINGGKDSFNNILLIRGENQQLLIINVFYSSKLFFFIYIIIILIYKIII